MASASAFRRTVASLALLALFALPAAGFCQSCAAPPALPASAQFHANHCASMAHSSRAGMALLPRDCGQKPAACSLAAELRGKPAWNLLFDSCLGAELSHTPETQASSPLTAAIAYLIPPTPPQRLTLRI